MKSEECFNSSFFILFILRRYHPVFILEVFGEIAGIVEAYLITYFAYGELALENKLLGMTKTDVADKLRRSLTSDGRETFI